MTKMIKFKIFESLIPHKIKTTLQSNYPSYHDFSCSMLCFDFHICHIASTLFVVTPVFGSAGVQKTIISVAVMINQQTNLLTCKKTFSHETFEQTFDKAPKGWICFFLTGIMILFYFSLLLTNTDTYFKDLLIETVSNSRNICLDFLYKNKIIFFFLFFSETNNQVYEHLSRM